jgi:hypothetical protein
LIDSMSKALVGACQTLGLNPKTDPMTRVLAMRIIAEAREGVHSVALLRAAALKSLDSTKHQAARLRLPTWSLSGGRR